MASLKLTHGDSRVQTYRTYQALKEESNSENQVWIKSTWKRRYTRRLEYKVLSLSLVKNRLALIAQAYTHTKILVSGLTGLRFVFCFSSKTSSYLFVCVSIHHWASNMFEQLVFVFMEFWKKWFSFNSLVFRKIRFWFLDWNSSSQKQVQLFVICVDF